MKYLTVFLALSLLEYLYACSCPPRTDTEIYCSRQPDFGVLVEVQTQGTNVRETNLKKYRIELKNTLMSTVDKQDVLETFIYTAPNSALCGAELEKDTLYFISGKYFDIGQGQKKGMKTELCLDLQKKLDSETYTPPSCYRR